MDLKSTYNKIAKDWSEDHSHDTWWIEGTDKFLSLLDSSASILDVGCGGGYKSKYMDKKGFKVTGIDFSEEMIKLAKGNVPAANFFVKDIKKPLGFQNSFDGIFAHAVLLHIPKKEVTDVLKNITEPLKSGGFINVAVKEIRPGNKDEEILKEEDYGYEYKRFFSYYTMDELKKYITDISFEVVYSDIITSGDTNWIQIIARK